MSNVDELVKAARSYYLMEGFGVQESRDKAQALVKAVLSDSAPTYVGIDRAVPGSDRTVERNLLTGEVREIEPVESAPSARCVVVPMEPSVEMMLAALSEHRKWEGEGNPVGAYWPRIYKAMLAAAPVSAAPNWKNECRWRADDDGIWHTTCKNAFTFIDAGPKENSMKFCCYCGGTLIEERDAERPER